ncbi:MAG TPA: AAA family ATPase [Gemmatimonadaceae bacterium]
MSDRHEALLWPEPGPATARAVYISIKNRLARRFFAAPWLHSRLAIVAADHFLGITSDDGIEPRGARLVLTGPPGSGKTTAARAIAESLGLAFSGVWDCTGIVQQGYKGTDVQALMRQFHINNKSDFTATEHAVICVDELDKIAVRTTSDAVDSSVRIGQQQSLLPLFSGDGEMRFSADAASHQGEIVVRTRSMLVIGCGVFENLPSDSTTDDYVQHGLMRELAERITLRIALPGASPSVLVEVYRERAEELRVRFRRFGWDLEIPDETLRLLARVVASGSAASGSRAGAAWLEDAAQRRLCELLEGGAAEHTRVTLGPDDIDGAWRARRRQRRSTP